LIRDRVWNAVAILLQLGVAALVAWALWTALRPRSAFVVRVRGGAPQVIRGTVSRAFLHEIGETCTRHGVTDGLVRGVVTRGRVALAFSTGIPPHCRQQLRNLWVQTS
jgi:hypothetical protein